MRRLLLVLASALVVAGIARAASPASKTTAAAQRAARQSAEIEKRIDTLLSPRLRPEPLPKVLPNPFVVVSGVVTAQRADGTPDESAPSVPVNPAADTTANAQAEEFPAFTNAEMLARCIATLKFGGMIQLNDRVQLVINNVPRKEGDIVSVTVGQAKIYLRVVRIAPGSVTLKLNDAEQVVNY
jgi:hypothetical protein